MSGSTTANAPLTHGNFTGLAENYAAYRPAYSETVLSAIVGVLHPPFSDVSFADVGAGTGIWTRMVASHKPKSVVAVEPNDDMRQWGEKGNVSEDGASYPIEWRKGSAEETGLETASKDWLTMASSFHWADFDKATAEFHRVLKPKGVFTALWNPRWIEVNPLLVEIEDYLYKLAPHIKRVSSGSSEFTASLAERLEASPYFEDVMYLEGRHSAFLTPEQYLGVWRSVNDVRVQAGEECFQEFLNFVEQRTKDLPHIEAVYKTRAWVARRAD